MCHITFLLTSLCGPIFLMLRRIFSLFFKGLICYLKTFGFPRHTMPIILVYVWNFQLSESLDMISHCKVAGFWFASRSNTAENRATLFRTEKFQFLRSPIKDRSQFFVFSRLCYFLPLEWCLFWQKHIFWNSYLRWWTLSFPGKSKICPPPLAEVAFFCDFGICWMYATPAPRLRAVCII
jgi:hypothetical protein